MIRNGKLRLFLILLNVGVLTIDLCLCKPFNLRLDHSSDQTDIDNFFQKTYDVATGKREIEFRGNILDGTAEVSVSHSDEEILTMAMIGVGILLFFVCCGVCCKHCCCPRSPTRGHIYQQMGSAQRPPMVPMNTSLPGAHHMIPMGNHGFAEIHSQTPPPPYSASLCHPK